MLLILFKKFLLNRILVLIIAYLVFFFIESFFSIIENNIFEKYVYVKRKKKRTKLNIYNRKFFFKHNYRYR